MPQTQFRDLETHWSKLFEGLSTFQSAVQSAMQEVIIGQLTAKGLRTLNEGEFKPVEKQLVDRRHALPDEALASMAR